MEYSFSSGEKFVGREKESKKIHGLYITAEGDAAAR